MKSTCTAVPADQRVEGDAVYVASEIGPSTPKLGEGQGDANGASSLPEDVGESCPTISIEDDDISPDDAPEVTMEEIDGEVRDIISIGAINHGY